MSGTPKTVRRASCLVNAQTADSAVLGFSDRTDDGTRLVGEDAAIAYVDWHVEFFAELDRSAVHHARAKAGPIRAFRRD